MKIDISGGITRCSRQRIRLCPVLLRASGILPGDPVGVWVGHSGFDEIIISRLHWSQEEPIARYTVEKDGSLRMSASLVGDMDPDACTTHPSKGKITILRG